MVIGFHSPWKKPRLARDHSPETAAAGEKAAGSAETH